MKERLECYVSTLIIMSGIWFLPPRLRKMKFSYRLSRKLVTQFGKDIGLRYIFLFSERARSIQLVGDRKKLPMQYLGSTKLYPVASITLNFRSIGALMMDNKTWPLNTITLHEQIWQTLLHEMAHAASVKEPPTKDDHDYRFFLRMVKVYIYVWYQCYFGVLRSKRCARC